MVTINDIAKAAGVAQGTVSNVLNGKGNVSSEKIKRVMKAARELGYVPNERASLLRRGLSNSLAVIMPDSRVRQYEDFYFSFKNCAQSSGFSVSRHLVNENNPSGEVQALAEVRPLLVKGIALISSVAGTASEGNTYKEGSIYRREQGFGEGSVKKEGKELPGMVFIERRPGFGADFIGFDYERAGAGLGQAALQNRYANVCLLTGNLCFSNETDFYRGFMKALEGSGCQVVHIQTDSFRRYQNIMQILDGTMPQAFFISNYGFAESVKDICLTFYGTDQPPQIFTVSPVFTMPENDFTKYEMNYRQLGTVAAEFLIRQAGRVEAGREERKKNTWEQVILESGGFRDWYSNIVVPKNKKPLNVITLDSPEAYIMRNFSRLYTRKTGIDVNICIYSYDEIYEALNTLNESSDFDVLRLDVTWLSWFAEKVLLPLTDIDPDITNNFGEFLNGTPERYARVHGRIYALPSTPSVQILYYRKDLFESPIYKRMYYEQFRTRLAPPESFREFNRIAAFFTKAVNRSSPVDYGATVTLGSSGVAGSEYLARLFSHQDNLYDSRGEIHLDSQACLNALEELIEVKSYTAEDYCGWWTNTARSFAGGNYAMSVFYSNYASDLLGHASNIVGRIGYATMPGGNPVIGGGSLGVSRYSQHPKDALSFIKWMCSEPVSSAASLLGSTSPCKKTYENYEVIHNFPWMSISRDSFTYSQGKRVPDQAGVAFDERRFLSILGMAVKNAYSKIAKPQEALRNAQEQFERFFWRSR